MIAGLERPLGRPPVLTKSRPFKMCRRIRTLRTEPVEKICRPSHPNVVRNFPDGYFCGSLCPPIGLPLRCNASRPIKEQSPMKFISTKICTVILSTFVAATITYSAYATPISPLSPGLPPSTGGGNMAALDSPGSPLPPLPPPCTGNCSVAALDSPGSPLPPLPPPCTGSCSVAALDSPGSPLPPLPPPCTGNCSVAALDSPGSPLPPNFSALEASLSKHEFNNSLLN